VLISAAVYEKHHRAVFKKTTRLKHAFQTLLKIQHNLMIEFLTRMWIMDEME